MHQIRPLAPGDAGWVLARHGRHYCIGEGFDRSFEAVVADRLARVLGAADPAAECGWIGWAGVRRVGCIFYGEDDPETARLRLFYVAPEARGQAMPEARGRGLAGAFLNTLTTHARIRGCRLLRVATHAEHVAAGRFYRREGFRCTLSRPVHSFGRTLTEQHWEMPLGHR